MRTVFVCPRITQATFFRGGDMSHQGAILFVEGDDESGDHGDEKGFKSHALLSPGFPAYGAVNGTNLSRRIGR